MKKLLLTLTLLSLALLPRNAFANENQKEEVDRAFSYWREAIASGNAANVVKLYDPHAVLLATLGPIPILTQKDRQQYFNKLISKRNIKATVNEEYIRILDHKNAVISGLYTFQYEDHGKLVQLPARYSFVFEREHGHWMIVSHHSSKIPSPE